ncbi:hypothetical protein DSUL_60037 [Desulfovibrionales bacterium]
MLLEIVLKIHAVLGTNPENRSYHERYYRSHNDHFSHCATPWPKVDTKSFSSHFFDTLTTSKPVHKT